MTKQEAIQQMQQGRKVKHYLFSDGEFIYMKNGVVHDEENRPMELETPWGGIDFWTDRQGEQWQDGWILLPD